MILWKNDISIHDSIQIRDQIAHTYIIQNPEKINGYYGFFDFRFGEIWIDEFIGELIKKDITYENFLEDLLKRFSSDDYGIISEDEKKSNMENRYFFGSFVGLRGAYKTKYGVVNICIIDKNITYLTIE